MSGVRRTTAHRLTQAWNQVPHVFQMDRADITQIEALRKKLSKRAEAEGRANAKKKTGPRAQARRWRMRGSSASIGLR